MASYMGLLWSQADLDALPWHKMTIQLESNFSSAPSRANIDEWKELLPYQPHEKKSIWQIGPKGNDDRQDDLVLSIADIALQNEIALERRLALDGWLMLRSMPTSTHWRGKELVLHVVPGNRWTIGDIHGRLKAQGLRAIVLKKLRIVQGAAV